VINSFNDKRIKSFNQENKGQSAAANTAFCHSNGIFIKFMDADDLISADFIGNQVKAICNEPDAIAFSAWGRFYNGDLNTFKLIKPLSDKTMHPAEWLIESMTGQEIMMQCARWLIPRTILNRSGLWNEELSVINDFEFFIRVLLCARQLIYNADDILYYRSGLPASLSGRKTVQSIASAFNSIDWGTQHLLNYENSARVKKIAADSFQRLTYKFYPLHPDYIKKAEIKIKDLGGSDIPFPAGGLTKLAASLFGWKLTKLLKNRFNL
jgi:glycosyltransferase involved in cell wall biosynthesis